MRSLDIEHSNAEIVFHSGLGLIGQALDKHTDLVRLLKKKIPQRHGISHRDTLFSYIGLLSVGKSDCDAIENVRDSYFFSHALGVDNVPSAATLRQRLDRHALKFNPLVEQASVQFLNSIGATITPLACGYGALDADVMPMDNSRTKKWVNSMRPVRRDPQLSA